MIPEDLGRHSQNEFIEAFRYCHWLLRHDPETMSSFELYRENVGRLRSDFIRELRISRVPGYWRARFNDSLERYVFCAFVDYLWFKDKRCALCGGVIQEMVEVTTDHIVPTSLGGENLMSNKQIAHAHCNNKLKSGRNIQSFSVLSL